jgi:predicted PurR-regulated permease PerM
MASASVAVTYAAVRVLASMSSMLVLIGVAFFLALGLEPAVSWFVKQKLPRWAAITLVFVIFQALMGAFIAAAIPAPAQQAGQHRPGTALHSAGPGPFIDHRQAQ